MRYFLAVLVLLFAASAEAHGPVRHRRHRQSQSITIWVVTPTGWQWVRYPVFLP